MPISKLLPDGRVEIYNSKTGAIKQVTPEELPSFNPALVGDYLKMKQSVETPDPVKELASVKAKQELEQFKLGTEVPIGTSEQQFKTKAAGRAIEELKRVYGRGDTENVGTDKDLSLSSSPSGISRGLTKAKRAISGFLGIDNELTQDIKKFKSQRNIAVGILTQAMGSGTPQEGEAKRLIASMPNETSTNDEAKAWFDSVQTLIGGQPQKKNEVIPPTDITQPQTVSQTEQPQGDSFFKKVALKVADIAPAAGGLVGGLTGGALGVGVMSAATGAGGTAAGYAGGKVIQNTIRDLLGAQDKDPLQQITDSVSGAAKEAAFDALGFGVGKYILKPIAKGGGFVLKSLAKNIDDIPLKGIRINPSQLTKFSSKHGEDVANFMVNRGYLGEDAIDIAAKDTAKFQETFDNLALNKNISVPINDIAKRFSQEISDLAGGGTKIVSSFNKKLATDLMKEWNFLQEQLIRQGRNSVGLDELTNFRRSMDKLIPDSVFIDRNIKNVQLRLRGMFNDIISESIDKHLLPEVAGAGEKGTIKKIGQELSRLYDFLDIAEKQSNLGRGSLVGNLTRILSGGGGGAIGAVVGGIPGAVAGGAAGLASEALLRDPNVLKGIYKTGQKVMPKVLEYGGKATRALPQTSRAAMQALGQLLQQ